MPTIKPRTQFLLSPDARAVVDCRAEPISGGLNLSGVADCIFLRYAELMREGLRHLPGKFSTAEIALLIDVLGSGTSHDELSIRNLSNAVADALPDYANLHGVGDPTSFLESVEDLGVLERYALIDAIERFGAATARGEEPEIRAVFA